MSAIQELTATPADDTESVRLFDNLGLMTVDELARALGKAPKTIRNWVAKRTIPFVVLGRTTMFRKRAIEAWLERKERKPCR